MDWDGRQKVSTPTSLPTANRAPPPPHLVFPPPDIVAWFWVTHPNTPTLPQQSLKTSQPISPSLTPPTNGFPLSKSKPLRVAFAKTEPQWLGFGFFTQIPPPSLSSQSPPPVP
ncbi:hypothetical protein PILCRDRAFT_10516 [Piloderma croceum F 1598]|uniref:Uncharacterized protein n=1 Tax=Piloderma croceum (strain F 1598) TaxID=765440 RepID=A0A0C3FHY9_PILCF|nr:hypothetical protein PILCRDRAFT_10516 [Piloderma croceum F 1598]